MHKTLTACLTLSAVALFFAACVGDSTIVPEDISSSSVIYDEFENIIQSPSDPIYSQPLLSSGSVDNPNNPENPVNSSDSENPGFGNEFEQSSSSVVQNEIPDLCGGQPNYTQIPGANGSVYVCLEQHTLFPVATYDDLPECDDTYMGNIAYLIDEESAYTCVENKSWRYGIFEVDLNPIQVTPDGACPDSLAGREVFSEEFNGRYACQNGIWVLTKSFAISSSSSTHTPVPVDYSAGRAMNKKLGKGINMGNSWESTGSDDCGWNNCIEDGDFAIIKQAGFNSVRIPVRWEQDANGTQPNASRMAGVKADIRLAIAQGLVVVVNFHHYGALEDKDGAYSKNPNSFNTEKQRFLGLWENVAKAMDEFPDDMLVLEILNEPLFRDAQFVRDLMLDAYKVIRENAPGKTIMFESYHAAKFYDLDILDLPEDGNIIYSGHYYEPFSYSHQGDHGYDCKGDAAYRNAAAKDLAEYAAQAKKLYPDTDGVNSIPLNMGEFGISGSGNGCGNPASDSKRAQWAGESIKAAEANGMSWHYWGFKRTGGFDAYSGSWKPGFLDAFFGK